MIRKTIVTVFIILGTITLTYSSNYIKSDISKTDSIKNIQDSLSFELSQIFGLDQGIRNNLKGIMKNMGYIQKIDSANFYRIIDFIKKNGVPNANLLGKDNYSRECVEGAVICVLLHTPHMIVNSPEHLNFFANLVKRGEMSESFLSTVLDKYYFYKYRKSYYGISWCKPCISDKNKSDSLRTILGFKPLPDSVFINCNNKRNSNRSIKIIQ
jgi:hypothetical protein